MNSNTSIAVTLWIVVFVAFLVLAIRRMAKRDEELGRFRDPGVSRFAFVTKYLDRFVRRHSSADIREKGRILISVSELKRLGELGLGADQAVVRYVMLREGWIAVTLAVCCYSLLMHSPTFAALFTSAAIVLAVWVPRGLLDLQWEARQWGLRLEIPIVIGLLRAGTQARTEVVRVFEDCADTLRGKHIGNSFADSIVRAQACSRVVGSWQHSLEYARSSCPGDLIGEALDTIATVMRSDNDDVSEQLEAMVTRSEQRLMEQLADYQRLIVAKVTVLIAACMVGGLLLSGVPLWIRWGG